MKREVLFPTPFYWRDLPNAKQLNQYLFKHIKSWHKQDVKKGKPTGEFKTNSGYGWHSETNMNDKKEYQPLIHELFVMAEILILHTVTIKHIRILIHCGLVFIILKFLKTLVSYL